MSARSCWSCAPIGRPKPTYARRPACFPAATMSACCSTGPASPSPGAIMEAMTAMVVATDFALCRHLARFALAAGLLLVAALGQAQTPPAPPPSGVSYDAPPEQAAELASEPEATASNGEVRARTSIHPYLVVSQVVSSDLDSGDTLTYTSVAVGVDGIVQTQRVIVQLSYRYQRLIEWGDDVGDQDMHSGLAAASIQIVPGALSFDAGAMATRTGGEGRAVGTTVFDPSV